MFINNIFLQKVESLILVETRYKKNMASSSFIAQASFSLSTSHPE